MDDPTMNPNPNQQDQQGQPSAQPSWQPPVQAAGVQSQQAVQEPAVSADPSAAAPSTESVAIPTEQPEQSLVVEPEEAVKHVSETPGPSVLGGATVNQKNPEQPQNQ